MKKIIVALIFLHPFFIIAQEVDEVRFIYAFVKEIMAQQNIDLNNGLQLEAEPNVAENQDDKTYLKSLLINENEINRQNYSTIITLTIPGKCLTKKEMKSMLDQKRKFKNFKWDNSILGFNIENKKNYYTFSVPLFSPDKTKAVMMIKSICPGLCGSGQTILFKKENGEWTEQILGMFYY